MLPAAATYEAICQHFRWDLPTRYNMAFDVCDKWAEIEPDRLAIIDLTDGKRRDIGFGELKALSDAFAVHLGSLGIARGDRVGIYRSQSLWTAVAHIAVWKLGAISIPLFKLFGEEALETRLMDSGARAVVTDVDGADILGSMQLRLPDLKFVIVAEDVSLPPVSGFVIADTGPDDPAVIIYTSGTTGAPKGALHGHRILPGHLPGVEMSHDCLPHEGDVLWTPADWAWIGGLFDVLMPGLYHGIPVVAARMAKFSGAECLRIIKSAKVRNIFFPPTALKMLKAENVSISGLRSVASGGEPLGEEMLEWGRKALGVTINEFYGQTECNMVVSSAASLFDPLPGAIGKPVPGHVVEVIDESANPVAGEGDIAILEGTPVMMLEYWSNPEVTAAKFRTDQAGRKWLLTGDRGVREGGFIRFVGRDDDVITSAGYRIGPGEIEDCLIRHEAVSAAAVVGKPDPVRTQIIKAYVVLKPGFSPDETLRLDLQNHVRSRLAAHEYPREVEFLGELPMTVTGKIIRRQLRQRAIEEAADNKQEA